MEQITFTKRTDFVNEFYEFPVYTSQELADKPEEYFDVDGFWGGSSQGADIAKKLGIEAHYFWRKSDDGYTEVMLELGSPTSVVAYFTLKTILKDIKLHGSVEHAIGLEQLDGILVALKGAIADEMAGK